MCPHPRLCRAPLPDCNVCIVRMVSRERGFSEKVLVDFECLPSPCIKEMNPGKVYFWERGMGGEGTEN